MKSAQALFLASACVSLCYLPTFGAAIPGLYGTGVLDDGSLAAGGSADLHYALISTPSGTSGTAYVTTTIPSPYTPQGPRSKWISPGANATTSRPIGNYIYRTKFDLTGLDPATAKVSFGFSSDDGTAMYLNGTYVGDFGATNTLYDGLIPYTITNGFVPGTNVFDFGVVNSFVSPTGLRIDDFRGTALPDPKYPALSIRVSQVELCWVTRTGSVYQIQYKSELTTNQWINWGVPFSGIDGTICTNDAVADVRRFYRLVVTP